METKLIITIAIFVATWGLASLFLKNHKIALIGFSLAMVAVIVIGAAVEGSSIIAAWLAAVAIGLLLNVNNIKSFITEMRDRNDPTGKKDSEEGIPKLPDNMSDFI